MKITVERDEIMIICSILITNCIIHLLLNRGLLDQSTITRFFYLHAQGGLNGFDLYDVPGIAFMHFSHVDGYHFRSNMGLLSTLLFLTASLSNHFLPVMLIIYIGVMILNFVALSPDTIYIGASGIVFALFGYVCTRIVLNKINLVQLSLRNILKDIDRYDVISYVVLTAALILMFWLQRDTIINGMFPEVANRSVSYASHKYGFIVGIFTAVWELVHIHKKFIFDKD